MVGFPGETETAFNELYKFVRDAAFDHLGAFVFSPEEGAPAARFAKRVPRKRAEERLDAIMSLQAEISMKKNLGMVGETALVLIEGSNAEADLLFSGRTAAMAPEVDGRVVITKGMAKPGEMVPVLIKGAQTYDLIGEIP